MKWVLLPAISHVADNWVGKGNRLDVFGLDLGFPNFTTNHTGEGMRLSEFRSLGGYYV